jgi:hypothetical protein
VSHARGDADAFAYGASIDEAVIALNALEAPVIGVAVGATLFGRWSSNATDSLLNLARLTGAVVPTCAWGTTERPTGCGPGLCCTGLDGAGEPSFGDQCPLVFKVNSGIFGGTTRLDVSVIRGIEALLGGSSYDLVPTARRDEAEFAASGIDTTCFLDAVVPLSATSFGCSSPSPIDTNGDGVADAFTGVAPGATVNFRIDTTNDCVEATASPQVFKFYVDLLTSDGASLGTKLVTVLVPPQGDKD